MKLNELKNLHDWEIINIATNFKKKAIKITIKHPEKDEILQLKFHGVFEIYISKMKLQNVILDVIVFEENCDSDYLEYCLKILKVKDLAIFPEYCLIYFEPSVGAEIACICREIIVN